MGRQRAANLPSAGAICLMAVNSLTIRNGGIGCGSGRATTVDALPSHAGLRAPLKEAIVGRTTIADGRSKIGVLELTAPLRTVLKVADFCPEAFTSCAPTTMKRH